MTSSATVLRSKAFWSNGERSSNPATSVLAHVNMWRILRRRESNTSSTLASGSAAVCVCVHVCKLTAGKPNQEMLISQSSHHTNNDRQLPLTALNFTIPPAIAYVQVKCVYYMHTLTQCKCSQADYDISNAFELMSTFCSNRGSICAACIYKPNDKDACKIRVT